MPRRTRGTVASHPGIRVGLSFQGSFQLAMEAFNHTVRLGVIGGSAGSFRA